MFGESIFCKHFGLQIKILISIKIKEIANKNTKIVKKIKIQKINKDQCNMK